MVIYHFFPRALPGGFVGVDVFFVISGFLITAHLLSAPPRSARDLADFWGRRIRRLLPASFLVLAVTLVVTLLVAPTTVWAQAARQIAASALYVQNWFLAGEAVDYLAADDAPSPVQHFWSLSVEEQFYLVWPILILLAAATAARRRRGSLRATTGIVVTAVTAASLSASVWITATDPAAAYFVTWTRVWELGIGALAACLFPWIDAKLGERKGARVILAYVGLGGILVAGLTYSETLAFPGYAAALPVVATALVLVAAVRPAVLSPLPVMSWRPVQLAGDLSYSIYLWHWPAIVLLPYAVGAEIRGWQKLGVIAAVIALAWVTKVAVEDRFRGRRPLGLPLRRSFVFALAGMVAFSAAGVGVVQVQAQWQARQESTVEDLLGDPSSCFGAYALGEGADCDPHGTDLYTDPVFAADDQPDPYRDGCWVLGDFSDPHTCSYGSTASDAPRVALVGNSHAGHWLPALQEIASDEDWAITTYLISECYTSAAPVSFETAARTDNCRAWNDRVIEEIADGDYDLVVISNRMSRPLVGMDYPQTLDRAAEIAFGPVLDRWAAADVPVLVLRDTPYATDLDSVPDCVAAADGDLAACDGDRSREVRDPLAEAAAARAGDPHITLLDLTDRICRGDTCHSVVGGVIVYFDRGHLTTTFARSLAPAIASAASQVMAKASE